MRFWMCCLAPVAVLFTAALACSQVVLNEVLPAPGTDWTDNGIHSPQEDEWVELFNAGATAVDLTGWFLADGAGGVDSPRIGLAGALGAGEHLFLTGELALDWEFVNGFPAVGLSLNNSGDVIYLFQAAGGATTLVDSLAYGGSAPDVSLGRLPDGTGPWTDFDALTQGGQGPQPTPGGPNGGIATPKILSLEWLPGYPTPSDLLTVRAVNADADGIAESVLHLQVDGAPAQQHPMALVSGAPEYGTWETVLGPYPAGTTLTFFVRISDGALLAQTNDVQVVVSAGGVSVVLNEILADPPPAPDGDANGDGVRSTTEDEFVEILNTSTSDVDMSGWTIHDATGMRHEFTSGPVLQPGEIFVVFGGGAPVGIPAGVDVASSGGLSLNNTGDEVQLVGPDGVPRDVHAYGSEANADQSLIRLPDGDGAWTRPSDEGFGWAFSPGELNSPTTSLSEVSWARVKALYGD